MTLTTRPDTASTCRRRCRTAATTGRQWAVVRARQPARRRTRHSSSDHRVPASTTPQVSLHLSWRSSVKFCYSVSDTVVINCEFRFDKKSISFRNRLAKMFVQIVSYFVFHDFFLLSFYLLFLCVCVCVCVCVE